MFCTRCGCDLGTSPHYYETMQFVGTPATPRATLKVILCGECADELERTFWRYWREAEQ